MKKFTKSVSTAGLNPPALVYMCSGENFSNEKELVKMNKMLKKNRGGGFTLAELLIVIAIIAILVAIAMPIFTASLDDARDAVKKANIRAVKALAVNYILTHYNEKDIGYDKEPGEADRKPYTSWFVTATVDSSKSSTVIESIVPNGSGEDECEDKGDGTYTVTVNVKASEVASASGG